MITAIDTSILLDVFAATPVSDPAHAQRSNGAQPKARSWCPTWCGPRRQRRSATALTTLGVGFRPLTSDSAGVAGAAWRAYRRAGGPRTRVVTDFLVGAHAELHADRLLTRDRGVFRRYFTDLTVLDPTS